MRLPDDGTGALPLLRHIILNDAKSSACKLALLRTLCRIADGAAGMSRDAGESHVSVPLGLVALTWVRLFHPLIRGDFPQAPRLLDGRGLSFVRDGFREVLKLSAGDLRIGMRFSGEQARALHAALKDARETIVGQPVHYMTIPNSGSVAASAEAAHHVESWRPDSGRALPSLVRRAARAARRVARDAAVQRLGGAGDRRRMAAAWPCNDLWNLLPVRRDVNGRKGARLPDAATLQNAAERIVGWWYEGYRQAANPLVPERFLREAAATLPTLGAEVAPELEDIYEAMNLKRLRLKHDQRVPEWSG